MITLTKLAALAVLFLITFAFGIAAGFYTTGKGLTLIISTTIGLFSLALLFLILEVFSNE